MAYEILNYMEMCSREGCSLQRGMNFGLNEAYSVILMSRRPDAPYTDRLSRDGTVLRYEGHDAPRTKECPDPKSVDQPMLTPQGTATQNGKFFEAAKATKAMKRPPEKVKVYEKLRTGLWVYNGIFHLVDATRIRRNGRYVFEFTLVAVDEESSPVAPALQNMHKRRLIPSRVKQEVWKRDGGKCVLCGASENLHFDHIIPVSKGGSSTRAENIQLLCARHNLQKRDSIQ